MVVRSLSNSKFLIRRGLNSPTGSNDKKIENNAEERYYSSVVAVGIGGVRKVETDRGRYVARDQLRVAIQSCPC